MDQKYNIAIIAGQLVVGGAERQLYLWLSSMDRNKFNPVVLTLHPNCGDYWEAPIESLGIPLLRVPQRKNRLTRAVEIIRILRPYKPQLIHGWHLFASPYAGITAKILGAKSLGSLRDTYQTFCSTPVEANLTLLLVDAILANSHSTANQLRTKRRLGSQPIYAVQNAVEDFKRDQSIMRDEISRKFNISPTSTWIGSLGRLDPKKRFDLLLNIIALLKEEIKNFHFILIGDGPERIYLESLADTLKITKYITFAGEIPTAGAWLSAFDVFCFTSLNEGMPNVIMEAALASLPIIAWRLPFMEEVLDEGRVALLVQSGNLGDFKNKIVQLIHAPDLRMTLGRTARRHILTEFTVKRHVQRMTEIYENLLSVSMRSK